MPLQAFQPNCRIRRKAAAVRRRKKQGAALSERCVSRSSKPENLFIFLKIPTGASNRVRRALTTQMFFSRRYAQQLLKSSATCNASRRSVDESEWNEPSAMGDQSTDGFRHLRTQSFQDDFGLLVGLYPHFETTTFVKRASVHVRVYSPSGSRTLSYQDSVDDTDQRLRFRRPIG